MVSGRFGGLGDDRHVQVSPDDLRDVSHRNALVGNSVKHGSRRTLLQRQPEEMGGIKPMYRRPAVKPLTDIRRNAFFPCDANEGRNKAVITVAMN